MRLRAASQAATPAIACRRSRRLSVDHHQRATGR